MDSDHDYYSSEDDPSNPVPVIDLLQNPDDVSLEKEILQSTFELPQHIQTVAEVSAFVQEQASSQNFRVVVERSHERENGAQVVFRCIFGCRSRSKQSPNELCQLTRLSSSKKLDYPFILHFRRSRAIDSDFTFKWSLDSDKSSLKHNHLCSLAEVTTLPGYRIDST
ncbi:hypothetical protein RCL1_006290 [Eukaryota sp. TZLM3-RCL]